MDRERFDASGRECPGPGALTWRGRLREAEAIGVPLAAVIPRWAQVPDERAGKPATGPGSCSAPAERRARGVSPGRACGGHDGPETAGQGPCRNPRQTQVPRSVRTAAGATRAEGPEEGQADKPAPWPARRRLSDAGQHPATSGPRAISATPVRDRQRSCTTQNPYPEALPARGPPDCFSPTPRRRFSRGCDFGWVAQERPFCLPPPHRHAGLDPASSRRASASRKTNQVTPAMCRESPAPADAGAAGPRIKSGVTERARAASTLPDPAP